jgi:MFS family permease
VKLLDSLAPADFRRSIDAPLRRFFLGVIVSCFAMGLTLALYVVYLHNVLHFSTSFSTLLLATSSFAGLVTSPLWGTMTDLIGPVKVLLIAGVTDAGALVYWAFIHSERSAVVGGLLLAIFGGAGWGPGSTLMVRLVDPAHRQRAFGFNFMLVNFAIGAGGLVSALVVDLHHPVTFRWLYLGNAAVGLGAVVVYVSLWRHGRVEARPNEATSPSSREGWARVWRDRRLVYFVLASIVLMLGGYGAVDAGLSLYVVNNLHMSIHVIGVFLFVDTTVIVLAQLFVLNAIDGRSRTRVLALVGVLWCLFWVIVAVALAVPTVVAVVAISLAMVVFAIGETMLSPLGPAIINEIAPEHLRGRYNAAQGLSWGLSSSFAPAITAVFFDNGVGDWWPLCVGGLALAGGALMLNLRHHLSASEDGRSPR